MSAWLSRVRAWKASAAGNVTMIFALSLAPLTFIVGASIDLSRAITQQSVAQQALDAAGLAAARTNVTDEDELLEIAANFVQANLPNSSYDSFSNLNVSLDGSVLSLSADVDINTSILGALGVPNINMPVYSEVSRAVKKVELALVLDNTGSMSGGGKIGALRDAARALVNDLFEDENATENVRVGIVPYVTAVNVRGTGFDWDWIDDAGVSTHNGENFEPKTDHLSLFDDMDVEWKGCVEMRAAPYDTTDDEPVSGDTLWTPYLWPDEPESGHSGPYFDNDYFYDDEDHCEDCDGLWGEDLYIAQQADVTKYSAADIDRNDETASTTYGPNKSCGQEVTPLTNSQSTLITEIDGMKAWGSSGTNGAAGLMWGWRVLSPGEPYSEGVAYEDTTVQKALVLMTDGENQIVGDSNTPNKSHYSGYGYLSAERLGATSYAAARDEINERMAGACESIKDEGILLFTITFQQDSESLKQLFRDCASKAEWYFDSGSNAEIVEHFTAIAGEISQLRVSK